MHTVSSKWYAPKAKYVSTKRKEQMQIMKDKRKIGSGISGPEKTAVKKKKTNQPC